MGNIAPLKQTEVSRQTVETGDGGGVNTRFIPERLLKQLLCSFSTTVWLHSSSLVQAYHTPLSCKLFPTRL